MSSPEPHPGSAVPEDWFRHSFSALYPVLYAHRTVESARKEARFAARCVSLQSGDAVLDLCCGNGRHMATLLETAPNLTGLDYSPDLLRLARHALRDRARLVRADMRLIPFHACFDVVFNFFTSFGYFQTDGENCSVLRGLAGSLRAGGRFFLDYLNPAHVEHTLQPRTERLVRGARVEETRWIDHGRRRVNKITRVFQDGERTAELGESVRLYSEPEMLGMCATSGLEVERIFGDYEGHEAGPEFPRMMLTGHKKDRHGDH